MILTKDAIVVHSFRYGCSYVRFAYEILLKGRSHRQAFKMEFFRLRSSSDFTLVLPRCDRLHQGQQFYGQKKKEAVEKMSCRIRA